MELYKIAVDSAHRVTSARATANTFFFTIQSLLATGIGVIRPLLSEGKISASVDRFSVLLASIVGALLSVTWLLLLRSYKALNSRKFKIILDMEAELPAKPFGEEWKLAKEDTPARWRDRYVEQGTVEQFVPVVFVAVYVATGIWGLYR